jgi:hypothetical protein
MLQTVYRTPWTGDQPRHEASTCSFIRNIYCYFLNNSNSFVFVFFRFILCVVSDFVIGHYDVESALKQIMNSFELNRN